jgi:molecular chaperone DnaK
MAADNKLLGQFDLVGIPSAPRGVPQIEVNFDIDANGIVSVQARDKATGKEQQIRIQASGGLSKDDINKMVKDAEAHAEEDKKLREQVEAKNQAESLIHASEKTLKDGGDKIPADVKQAVEAAITDLKGVIGGGDLGQIRAKTEALAQASMKAGEALYKAQTPPPGGGPQGPQGPDQGGAGAQGAGPGGSEKVVDADFEEVDEKKKRGSA